MMDLRQNYLSEVLGLKHLPRQILWPFSRPTMRTERPLSDADQLNNKSNFEVTSGVNSRSSLTTQPTISQRTYAVFLETQPSAEEQELLTKMLSAIGQTQFEVTLAQGELAGFRHILNFSNWTKMDKNGKVQAIPFTKIQLDNQTECWNFGPLQNYIQGSPQDIAKQKKQAWEFLKKFKMGVL